MTNTIGIMHSGTEGTHDNKIDAFKSALNSRVNLDARNIHWAGDNLQKLRTHAEKLVADGVAVIVAAGGSASAEEAKRATENHPEIKVVCTSISGSVDLAPNMAGICVLSSDLDTVRLSLLYEFMQENMPDKTTFGVLCNLSRPKSDIQLAALRGAARAMNISLDVQDVYPPGTNPNPVPKIKSIFQDWKDQGIKAAVIAADPIFNNHQKNVTDAAKSKEIVAIYQWREFAEAHGLMSFGANLEDAYKQAGTLVNRILIDDEDPAGIGLKVLDNFELVLNKIVADELGYNFPPAMLGRANHVIEL